jgi:hypothetical protein
MKQIKFIAVALFLVVLGTMPVFASPSQVVVTNQTTVAYEALGVQRAANVIAPASANNIGVKPVQITLGNDLSNTNIVNLVLTGGAYFEVGSTYGVCASSPGAVTSPSAAFLLGSQTPSTTTTLSVSTAFNGVTAPTLPLSALVQAGANIWVTTLPVGFVGCSSSAALNLLVAASTPVSALGLGGNITNTGGGLVTALTANNVIAVTRQFSTSLNTGVLVNIDYLAGPGDGTNLAPGGFSTNLVAGSNSLALSNATLSFGIGSYSASLNQVVTLADSNGNWSGISRAYAVFGTDASNSCSAGNAIATANAPASGTIVLRIPAASNAITGAATTHLCVNVAGNVVIPSRNIFGSYSYELGSGTGLNMPPGFGNTSSTVLQAWTPNAYQAFNPYMYVGTSQDTMDVFCRFYNSSTRTANVFVDVYPSDGTVSTRQTLASIAPNTAGTYWGSTIGAGASPSLTAGTSYAALFTVTALPTQINGVSFFKRSTGDRQLPLYKNVSGGDRYLSE